MPENPDLRPHLTSGVAARRLGLSRTAFRRMVTRGDIRPVAFTTSGYPRFSGEDVDFLRRELALRDHRRSARADARARTRSLGRRASDHEEWARRRFLEALTDHFTDLVLIADAAGLIKYASPSHQWILGYDPEHLLGTNVDVILHKDDAPSLRTALSDITPHDGLALPADVRMLHQDGGWRIFTVIIRNRLSEPAINGVVINAQDITDKSVLVAELRRRAQEADAMARVGAALLTELDAAKLYAVILEQVAALLPCEFATIQLFRDGWAEIVAVWGEPAVPVGTCLFRVTDPGYNWVVDEESPVSYIPDTELHEAWEDVAPWVGEYRIRSTIGVPIWVDGQVLGCLTASSRTSHFFNPHHIHLAGAFGEQVTQALRNARLYAAEQERALAAKALAALRGEFVAFVSHELRTPLASIMGYSEALEAYWTDVDDSTRRDWVAKIVISANKQKRLVDDLLLVTVMDMGGLNLQPTSVPLSDLVESAATGILGGYPGQEIDLAGPTDLYVLVDGDRAQQVVSNVIDNAAKYSRPGTLITVRWTREDDLGVVRIRDRGPGISSDAQDLLFTRFGRLPDASARAGHMSTGLGLYLGRQLSEAMGGSVRLELTGPEGSTFVVKFPLAEAPEE